MPPPWPSLLSLPPGPSLPSLPSLPPGLPSLPGWPRSICCMAWRSICCWPASLASSCERARPVLPLCESC
ncbi:MAG: hypothetical protein EOO37_02410 [Cytophagaceae bacterium]|nr:MAG: hypothetical protein EOO37_02410 [Cytophagaceae bacterium]